MPACGAKHNRMTYRIRVGRHSIIPMGTPPYRAEQRGSLWYIADKTGQNVLNIEGSLTKFLPLEVEVRRIADALNNSVG
jgi:hypothetical protein